MSHAERARFYEFVGSLVVAFAFGFAAGVML